MLHIGLHLSRHFPPVASGTVVVCKKNTTVLGKRLVRKKSEENIRNLSPHDKDDFIVSAFLRRDVMPRCDAEKRPVAAAAWRRRWQLGGSMAGNKGEARWWLQLSFSLAAAADLQRRRRWWFQRGSSAAAASTTTTASAAQCW